MVRYRFSQFTLSPQRRVLVREGREVPLIPRYFDLLVFLVEHRHEAVHRRDIFERYGEKKLYEGGLSVRTTLDPMFLQYEALGVIEREVVGLPLPDDDDRLPLE